jgi:hypothetical protein
MVLESNGYDVIGTLTAPTAAPRTQTDTAPGE